LSGIAGRAQSLSPEPLDLLNQYAEGHGGRAAASLVTVPHSRLEALGKAVQKAATPRLKVTDERVVHRRRLAAATLMLDLAHTGLYTQWKVLSPMIEWGCGLVRKNPAGQAEHDWHRAAIALAGAARDASFLVGIPINGAKQRVFDHVKHAADQFPDDPRWRLARAMALEFPVMSEGARDDGGSTESVLGGATRFAVDPERILRQQQTASSRALKALEELLNVPDVAAEAHLHLGHQRFVLRQWEGALNHYGEAARLSDDPHVDYLAFFLAGRLFDGQGAKAEAERHYQRALETMPNVQSATTAVSAARFVHGAPDEAYELLESAFSAMPRPPDPWRLFFRGDYRFWPALIDRLHAEGR
jgi:tetratricopeptide (TPR) repeat protein